MNKKIIILGLVWGGLIGGYIPSLFGAGIFSLASVLGSFFGGLLGIWLTFKMIN